MDSIAIAINMATAKESPWIEASDAICHHYNRGKAFEGFKEAGYFQYGRVKVCLRGTLASVKLKEASNIEQTVFGGR